MEENYPFQLPIFCVFLQGWRPPFWEAGLPSALQLDQCFSPGGLQLSQQERWDGC